MLSRSFVAVLCGALAVAGVQGRNSYDAQGYGAFGGYGFGEQWVAQAGHPQPGYPDVPSMHPPGPPGGPPPHPGPPGHPPPPPGPHHPPPPPGHHPHPKVDDKTIYQALSEDARFSRVFKLVNYTEEITSLLNDSSASVTFFAPPDKALRPPKPHHPHHPRKDIAFDQPDVEAFFTDDVIESSDEDELFAAAEGFVDAQIFDDDKDDEDKQRKKKIIKKIVTAVLSYHILPAQLPAADLAKNTTFPTSLKLGDGSLHSQPLRLRVEQPPRLIHPTLVLNFYAHVIYADVKTKNGHIHVVNHPLFPPPSIFQTLFAFTDVFSTFSSAIQRTKLTEELDWHFVPDSKTVEGSPALTVYAPTNDAFQRLPRNLKLYLFSPFGARALKKILSLHVVPEFVLHSNWAHNASDDLTSRAVVDPYDAYGRLPAFHDIQGFDFDEELISREFATFNDNLQSPESRRPIPDLPRPLFISCPSPFHGPHGPPRASCAGPPPPPPPFGEGMPPPPPHGWMHQPPPHHPMCPPPIHFTPPGLPPPFGPPHHWSHPEELRPDLPREGPPTPLRAPWDYHNKSRHPVPHPKPIYTVNVTLPTLLSNHTLQVHIAQFKSILPHKGYTTTVFVNGQWVIAPDVPARNGAFHVVKRLIKPRGVGKHREFDPETAWSRPSEEDSEDEWEDWEEWLPQWADEN